MSPPQLLAVGEVAHLLGVHINTVRNWGDRGILPMYRVGPRRDRRFRRKDIILFLKGSARAPRNWRKAESRARREAKNPG